MQEMDGPFLPRPTLHLEESTLQSENGGARISWWVHKQRASQPAAWGAAGERKVQPRLRAVLRQGKASRELGRGWLRDTQKGSWPRSEALPCRCRTAACLLRGSTESQPRGCLLRMISCPLSLLLPSKGNQTCRECRYTSSKLHRLSLKSR